MFGHSHWLTLQCLSAKENYLLFHKIRTEREEHDHTCKMSNIPGTLFRQISSFLDSVSPFTPWPTSAQNCFIPRNHCCAMDTMDTYFFPKGLYFYSIDIIGNRQIHTLKNKYIDWFPHTFKKHFWHPLYARH